MASSPQHSVGLSVESGNASGPARLLPGEPGIRLGFGGHQTFPFRYGWLKKAVDSVTADPGVFSRPDAIVVLGVGKNMVESIRHWGLASRVLEEAGRRELCVSPLGKALFQQWDPYLEDPASLWLIHWLVATNPTRAGVWHFTFTKLPRPDFTKAELLRHLADYVERWSLRGSASTLKRDVDVLIRMYSISTMGSKSLEDSFDCPLAELSLLSKLDDVDGYRFNIGPKRTLPVGVVGFALSEHHRNVAAGRKSISVHECLYGAGSPGQVFKLDEDSLVQYLEDLESLTNGALLVDDTAGLQQVYVREDLAADDLLSASFEVYRARAS